MKILLYGFKPFLGLKKNISEEVVKKAPLRKNLKKIVFDVKFGREQFLAPIKKFKPDVIIGLGLYGRGEKIRIERKAINLFWKKKNDVAKKISKNGPDHYFASLKIKKDNDSWLSYNAGKYVCNYSMYVILDYCKYENIKYGFIHIPKKASLQIAYNFVKKVIDKL